MFHKTCEQIMTKNPVHCLVSDTVEKAAQLMKVEDVGAVPIVDDEETMKLRGILTDRDIVIKVIAEDSDPSLMSIGEVMTRDPIVCRPEEDAEKAMKAMATNQIRRIPVVDQEEHLVGIIAQGDVAQEMDKKKTGEVVKNISQPTH